MEKILSSFILFLCIANSFAQSINLSSDISHSRAQFSATHMKIADITGNFEKYELKIDLIENNIINSKIYFETDINSINTHIEARDNHLKSSDFFDAEKFPKMTFNSKSIKKIKKNQYNVTGDLNLRGITKSVSFTLIYRGSTINPRNKKKTYGFQFLGSIKRSDFGIGKDYPEIMISDKVQIKGDFEMIAN